MVSLQRNPASFILSGFVGLRVLLSHKIECWHTETELVCCGACQHRISVIAGRYSKVQASSRTPF